MNKSRTRPTAVEQLRSLTIGQHLEEKCPEHDRRGVDGIVRAAEQGLVTTENGPHLLRRKHAGKRQPLSGHKGAEAAGRTAALAFPAGPRKAILGGVIERQCPRTIQVEATVRALNRPPTDGLPCNAGPEDNLSDTEDIPYCNNDP